MKTPTSFQRSTARRRRLEVARALPRTLSSFAAWPTALLTALLASGGCAVGPDFKRPVTTVPQSWRDANNPRIAPQAAADSRWWKAFNDPVLDQLIDLAHAQNLPLQIAGLRIVEARAQLGIATGLLFPQTQVATGSASAVGLSQSVANVFSLPTNHFQTFQLGFDAAWELDFWGKYRRGVESENASVLASIADYDYALVSVAAEVARTYVMVRTFEVLIEQTEGNVKIQEEALGIADSRFHNGATSELDPTQAATLLETTRATIPQLQGSLRQARNALNTLLGQLPGTVDAMLGGRKGLPATPDKVAVGVPAEMLRRRPDIRSAELNAAAQCARIGVAKAELYPSFSLLGTLGVRSTSSGLSKIPTLFSSDSIFYSVGPQINWAFLNYGRITNGVRVQDARFQQTLVNYRDTVLRAAQEVEDAMSGLLSAQSAAAFEQNAVKSAQRSVDLSLIAYREGATDYQRVLDAQRSLVERQNSLTQSNSSVATNAIALYKALGGGWESRQGQPVVPEQTRHEMEARTNWGDVVSQPRPPEATPTASPPTP